MGLRHIKIYLFEEVYKRSNIGYLRESDKVTLRERSGDFKRILVGCVLFVNV